jgi:hypothetical protein
LNRTGFLLAFLLVPSLAHAEPITAVIFGTAFAATTAGAIVSYGLGVAISRSFSILKRRP